MGDYPTASAFLEEGLALTRELDHKREIVGMLRYLADVALSQGDDPRALILSEEGLTLERNHLGSKENLASLQRILGLVRLHQGEHTQAGELLRESLALAHKTGNKRIIAESLEALVEASVQQGQPRRAAYLGSAADALRTAVQAPLPLVKRPPYDRALAAARTQLGEAAFSLAWREGRTLPLEQVIAEALDPTPTPESTPRVPLPAYPADLTEREVEVLRLVAAGLTTAQVAAQLVLSPRTVSSHLESIYSKIGVHSRGAATRFAIQHAFV
jgi:non-specific serine/threonine protein kinase